MEEITLAWETLPKRHLIRIIKNYFLPIQNRMQQLEAENKRLKEFKKTFDKTYDYYLEESIKKATPETCAVVSVLFGIKEEKRELMEPPKEAS